MTTAADRRRIPGPTSSYPALPLSSYISQQGTKEVIPTSRQRRDRPLHEPRKICTFLSCIFTNVSSTNQSNNNCPGVSIHRNIVTIDASSSVNSWTPSSPAEYSIFPYNPSEHHHNSASL